MIFNKKNSFKNKNGNKESLFVRLKNFFNKNILRNKSKFNFKETLLFMVITLMLGILIGGIIMYGHGGFSGHGSNELNEFARTYNDILNNYYQEVDADELLESGLSGMIRYLGDPYAAYMTEEESKDFNETIEGEYCGIGAEIVYTASDGITKVGTIFEGSPAEKAGLKAGDILKAVNGESIENKTTSEIAEIVKGKKGTKVTIKVLREEQEINFTIKRDTVDIPSVESNTYEENDKKIGYIALSVFAENTDEQFKEELIKLENDNIDSLIIDLRGNTGGYLTSVTNIISMFTEKGTNIYQLKTKDKVEIVKDKTKEHRTYPVTVLVNGSSASASEVLAAALKENYGATIMGTKTYGKGKVQKSYTLSNGSMVKYTHQEWLTPNGNSIDGVGVEPDIEVIYEYGDTEEIDSQLMSAIKEISQKQ